MAWRTVFLACFLGVSSVASTVLNAQPLAYAPGTSLHYQVLAANNVYTKPNTPTGSPGRLTILAYNIYPASGSACCNCKNSHCVTYANETIWNVSEDIHAKLQVKLAVAGQPQGLYLGDTGYLLSNNPGQAIPSDATTNFGALTKSGGKTFLGGSWSACPDSHGDYAVSPGQYAGVDGCEKIKILLHDIEVNGKRIGAYNYGPSQLPSCCN